MSRSCRLKRRETRKHYDVGIDAVERVAEYTHDSWEMGAFRVLAGIERAV
jgi:hypothetical protein